MSADQIEFCLWQSGGHRGNRGEKHVDAFSGFEAPNVKKLNDVSGTVHARVWIDVRLWQPMGYDGKLLSSVTILGAQGVAVLTRMRNHGVTTTDGMAFDGCLDEQRAGSQGDVAASPWPSSPRW